MNNAKRSMIQGVAVVTLIAAVVAMAHALKKNKKARMLKRAALDAKEHIVAHAKKLGGVSKASYARIVDAVMAEYANMKTLSKEEIAMLALELKDGWEQASKKRPAKMPKGKKR